MKVLLVDDEPAARRGMAILLRAHADIEIIGEVGSVAEARVSLAEEQPDLIFLDVEMPKADGFALKDSIADETRTIFVTAYAEYAAQAFDVQALDYLLKPVRPARLAEALDRARTACQSKAPLQTSIILRDQKKDIVVALENILALEAEGDYTRFLLQGRAPLLGTQNLGAYQQELPEAQFVRVSRSLIVNVERIDSLDVLSRDSSELHLKGLDQVILLKRAGTQVLRALLKELS